MAGFHLTFAKPARGRTSQARRRPSARPAFTLVELLIVVALLAVVLTLSLPSLRKLSAKSELRDAARQVRVALLETRLAAIESGNPACFRFQPGGDCFEAGRGPPAAAGPARERGPWAATEGSQSASNAADSDQLHGSQTLPHRIRFADPTADRQPSPPAPVGELPDDGSWSTPMFFYPNGRTLNARIALVHEPYRIELRVRGLTGTVQISQVERLPSLDAGTPGRLPEAATPERGPEAAP